MQPESAPTLLLVHGAWHGAWCWEEAFAPYLRSRGLNVVTIDLPGHGQAGPARIGWYSIGDYVAAVEKRMRSLPGPVIVLGHSMGGFVVQKLMERRPPNLAGAILLASASPRGVWAVVKNLIRQEPLDFLLAQLRLDLYHLVRTPEQARSKFYSTDLPEAKVRQYWSRISNESYRAFIDMLGLAAPRPGKADPTLPKLILGGGADRIFPPSIIQATAKAYGVSAVIFDDRPHSLNHDLGWEDVADHIHRWIVEQSMRAMHRTA